MVRRGRSQPWIAPRDCRVPPRTGPHRPAGAHRTGRGPAVAVQRDSERPLAVRHRTSVDLRRADHPDGAGGRRLPGRSASRRCSGPARCGQAAGRGVSNVDGAGARALRHRCRHPMGARSHSSWLRTPLRSPSSFVTGRHGMWFVSSRQISWVRTAAMRCRCRGRRRSCGDGRRSRRMTPSWRAS